MTPFPNCLVWVRFGSFGRQLAHVDKLPLDRAIVVVHKWRDNSRRWTGALVVVRRNVLEDEVDLVDPVVQRALKAATPGRPPCHHKHHFIPQVKAAAPRRTASHALVGGGL